MKRYRNLIIIIIFRMLYVLIQQKKNNLIQVRNYWNKNNILWPFIEKYVPESFKFITPILNTCTISHLTHIHHHMNETMEHKLHRIKRVLYVI